MKKNLLLLILTVIFSSVFFIFSCSNEKKEETVYERIKPKRIIKNNILVILGKDYYTRPDILKYLQQEYDLGGENSRVTILPYSDMVKNSKQPRLRMINEKIEEYKPTILISIGIPEGAGRYLINAAEKNTNLTIISLLPMDEILPLEAASDIVVDFQIPTALLEEKDFFISDDEVMLLLVSGIFAGEDINAHNKNIKIFPIEEFSQAFFTTQQVLGKDLFPHNYTIKPFLDSDTGLQSHRYIIIYKDDDKDQQAIDNSDNSLDETESDSEKDETINPDNLEGGA